MIRVVHHGSQILTFYTHPDPGVKKVPDTGSGSATLDRTGTLKNNYRYGYPTLKKSATCSRRYRLHLYLRPRSCGRPGLRPFRRRRRPSLGIRRPQRWGIRAQSGPAGRNGSTLAADKNASRLNETTVCTVTQMHIHS
jgi:hypothetical protein